MQKLSQPFALTGTRNTRELGGYRTPSGLLLKTHSLLRSDALNSLAKEDAEFLSGYGVRCVIDLRFPEEIERLPDLTELFPTPVRSVAVSLQDPVRKKKYTEEFPPSMWELYCWMLDESQAEFREIFETIAEFPDQCVLFHCTGGKDRTGMVTMLLLKLAGVDDATVVGDYALTETVMQDLFAWQTKDLESRGFTVPLYIMQSPPSNMEKTLRHLKENYGTAADYLSHIGLAEGTVQTLRKKLLPSEDSRLPAEPGRHSLLEKNR